MGMKFKKTMEWTFFWIGHDGYLSINADFYVDSKNVNKLSENMLFLTTFSPIFGGKNVFFLITFFDAFYHKARYIHIFGIFVKLRIFLSLSWPISTNKIFHPLKGSFHFFQTNPFPQETVHNNEKRLL